MQQRSPSNHQWEQSVGFSNVVKETTALVNSTNGSSYQIIFGERTQGEPGKLPSIAKVNFRFCYILIAWIWINTVYNGLFKKVFHNKYNISSSIYPAESSYGQGYAQDMKLKIYGTEQKPGENVRKKIDNSLCHDECLTYCTGTENHDCNQCKNLFYVDELERKVTFFFFF